MKTTNYPYHFAIKDRDGNALNPPAPRPNQTSQRAFERARTQALTQKQAEDRAKRDAARLVLAGDHPAPTVQEDLQAVRRRPLDAPMATRGEEPAWQPEKSYRLDDVVEPIGIGRAVLTLLLMATSFIAGLVVGRLA